jgi:hypothetical protein
MKLMGDTYVKDEFQRHLQGGKTTQDQWKSFLNEWTRYRDMLAGIADMASNNNNSSSSNNLESNLEDVLQSAASDGGIGRELDNLTPDQKQRLMMLKERAGKFGSSMFNSDGYKDGKNK